LILEDNPNDAGLTLRTLQKSDLKYVDKIVTNKLDYISALHEFNPDVVLSDHSLPSFTSEEALPILKDLLPSCVFILVTGTISEEFAVNILKSGADDYILKSSLMRLPSAIINAYLKKKAESERENNLKKLIIANNELKTFIYRASHDIRGPLSSMKGLINVAKLESENTGMSKIIELMDNSAEKLDKILVDLIETIGIREQNLHLKEIDFVKLINDILVDYKQAAKLKGIQFFVDIDDAHPFTSDKSILGMILKRIIDNSIKFHAVSSDSFIKIEIKSDRKGVKIRISDNGEGIKKELIDKVFNMFFRANYESDGNGLGLYLVKIGVEKLKGTIELKSQEQIGTKVDLFIPGSH
jgi:signal transduction histidine kinase